jgi:hypothetical protein
MRIPPLETRSSRMTIPCEPPRLTRYAPSGRVHPLAILLSAALLIPACLVAWPYQWNHEFLAGYRGRAVILAGCFAPLLGALAGGLTRIAVVRGHCRNPKAGLGIGWMLGGAAVLASHYVAWQEAAAGDPNFTPAQYLAAATTAGWTLTPFGMPDLSGLTVYLIWALEAGIVLGLAGWLGCKAAAEPYCESCRRWANRRLGRATIRSPGSAGLEQIRSAASVETLLHVPPPGPDAGGELGKDELVYTLRGCNRCSATGTLTVEWIAVRLGLRQQERRYYRALQEIMALEGDGASAARVLIERLGPHGESSRPTARTFARTD